MVSIIPLIRKVASTGKSMIISTAIATVTELDEDDYSVFPVKKKAIADYFRNMEVTIHKLPFCMTPCFFVKNSFQ